MRLLFATTLPCQTLAADQIEGRFVLLRIASLSLSGQLCILDIVIRDRFTHQAANVLVGLTLRENRFGVPIQSFGKCESHGGTATHPLFAMADNGPYPVAVFLNEMPNLFGVTP